MEEGGHSVADNGVIWLYMWNSTHRIRLTCTLKQNDHPGGSESVLHFGTPLYEIIFIKNDLWHHAVLSMSLSKNTTRVRMKLYTCM